MIEYTSLDLYQGRTAFLNLIERSSSRYETWLVKRRRFDTMLWQHSEREFVDEEGFVAVLGVQQIPKRIFMQ